MASTRVPNRAFGVHPVALIFGAIALLAVIGLGVGLLVGDDDEAVSVGESPVEIVGEVLPRLEGGIDPAVGREAPTITGFDFGGDVVQVGPGSRPSAVVFLAHWCPHCQAEVPRLVEAATAGVFDDIRLVGVSTATDPQRPNYPPQEWLDREGWPGDVLVDDEAGTAAQAYGLSGFPFIVWMDADGTVVARTSGELGVEAITALAGELTGA